MDNVLQKYTQYCVGEIVKKNGKTYFYNGNRLVPMDRSTTELVNVDIIETPSDIIKAFDMLQEKATELGYPIQFFDRNVTLNKGDNKMFVCAKVTAEEIKERL